MRRAFTVAVSIGLVLCAVLAAVFAAFALTIPESSARGSPVVMSRDVLGPILAAPQPPMDYFLAECHDLPDTASATAIEAVATSGQTRTYEMQVGPLRGMAESHFLGEYNPAWSFWTARGPALLRIAYIAEGCNIIEYADVPTLTPVARRNWIMDRSTCFGEATMNGRTYYIWPCIWEDTMGLSVTTLNGVGPGVTNDGFGIE